MRMSPCRGVCEMDGATGWCKGCGRTKSEILEWDTYDDAVRLGLIRKDLKERLRKMGRWPMIARKP